MRVYPKFGKNVLAIRETLGLEQKAVAAEAEISASMLSLVERKGRLLSMDALFRLRAALRSPAWESLLGK